MVSKKVLSSIISKYSLGNLIKHAIWEVEDGKMETHFHNDAKTLIGFIKHGSDIGLKKGNYHIHNTPQLVKCLNILNEDILIESSKSHLNMADTNYEIKFGLAGEGVIDPTPKDNPNIPTVWNITFDLSDEFITRFVKSKDALGDLDVVTVETREGFTGDELVFRMGTSITDTIEFAVEGVTIDQPLPVIPFNSDLIKEILKSNRDYSSGTVNIHNNCIKFNFNHEDNLHTGYVLSRNMNQ